MTLSIVEAEEAREVRSRFARHPREDDCAPRHGDTLVTLKVDPDMDLVRRMHLLTYSFAKWVQGSLLRQVVKWDLTNGKITFIVAGGPAEPSPTGIVEAELEDYPVEAEVTTINNGRRGNP